MSLKFVGQSAALICAFSLASAAAPAQTATHGVLACRSIADDTARLACFDRESAQLLKPTRSGLDFHVRQRPTVLTSQH